MTATGLARAATGRPTIPGWSDVAMLRDRVADLPAAGLDELTGRAALQTRVDRKYLVTPAVLTVLIGEMAARSPGAIAALDIDGLRTFGYSSVYFDTADLLCYRQHVQGRRRRYKVRTRTYRDSGNCMLEVKVAGARSQTVKERMAYPASAAGTITADGWSFVADRLAEFGGMPLIRPMLCTDYHRATLVDRGAGSRLTVDVGVSFADLGRTVAAPHGTVLVETKSANGSGPADALLRSLGARPVSVSKYCIGIALLHRQLPANPWHRVLRRHFGAQAGGSAPGRAREPAVRDHPQGRTRPGEPAGSTP